MDMEEMTVLQLVTVLAGSLLTSQKIDLEDTEETDRIIEESVRIVNKIKNKIKN